MVEPSSPNGRRVLASLALAATFALAACGARTELGELAVSTGADAGSPDSSPPDSSEPDSSEPEDGGALVLFGGQNSMSFLDDTWTFDGTSWSAVHAPQSPPEGTSGSMATLGDEVVLFGGYGADGIPQSDTWTFDGTTWSLVKTSPAPAPRTDACMSTLGDRIVLFGGVDIDSSNPAPWSTTWTFDGSSWSELTGSNPPLRSQASMAPLGGELVLFGGVDYQGNAIGDTWVYDGSSWSEVTAASGPPARYGAYEFTLGGKVFLFGGFSGSLHSGFGLEDSWTFDGTTWSSVSLPTAPDAVWTWSCAAMLHGSVVLFGGAANNGVFLNDTWDFDGSAWTELHVDAPPPPRVFAAMGFLR